MKYALLALMLVAFNASATKTNDGCQGNCPSTGGGTTNNEANSNANAYGGSGGDGTGVGVGIGVGTGGSAVAEGGRGGGGGHGGVGVGLGGSGGSVLGSGNSANLNSNTAKGGSAHQGQEQGQSLNSANLLRMTSENTVNASSANSNNSQASGNTTVTNVGGDSTLVERNAPPVFMGAITPTSCGGSFSAGGSDRNGSGAFGFSFVGTECAIRMLGDRYQAIGMLDTSCELYKSTKAFQKAAKRNPRLADLDCTIKPAPVPVVVPALVAPEIAHRVPRG